MPEIVEEKEFLLDVKGLSKRFPGVQALDDVNFSLRRGEIHALMGENGAGKSTLIKVITGVHRRDRGEVLFEGKPFEVTTPLEAPLHGISTVYQEVNLAPNLSVAENIYIGRQPMKGPFVDWKKMNSDAERLMKSLDVHIDVTAELAAYSIAIQQMVSIARAVDINAKILILDEPTSSLDSAECAQLFSLMRKLRSNGLGIIFITHFIDQVYEVTDQITVLRNGMFVGQFATQSCPRLELISSMLGKEYKGEGERRSAAENIGESKQSDFIYAEKLGDKGTVHPLTQSVRKGEILGVAGLLGSGRTEMAKSFFGILKSPEGTVRVDGNEVKVNTPRQAIRLGFAFTPEDRKAEGIVPELTVRENIILPILARQGLFNKLTRKESDEIVDRFIKMLNIKTPSPDQHVDNLSGGNQQKVILARWLAMNPRFLILDEPTRGIDIGAKGEIERIMGDLRDKEIAILFISSELEEVVRNSDRVVVLRDREKVKELSGAELTEETIMQTIAEGEA